jgi:hypothetical protein
MTRLQIPRPLARNGDLTLPDDHLPGQCRRGCHPGWTDAAFGREQAANTTATNQTPPLANPELTNPLSALLEALHVAITSATRAVHLAALP